MTLAPNSVMVRFYNNEHKDWFYSLFLSPYGIKSLQLISSSTAQGKFNKTDFKKILIPIPPLDEQKRINDKLDSLYPIVEDYSIAHDRLEILNKEIKNDLKKSILQEAIQGKLVTQCKTDEPASKLLEQIRFEKERLVKEGKIKKSALNDSIIFKGDDNKYFEKRGKDLVCIDDEIPFEIPNSWIWVRLGTIYSHCTGKALNSSNRNGMVLEYITTSNLYWNRFVLGKLRTMPFTDEELEKCTIRKGDLLVCEGGDIGRAAIWDYDYEMRIQNHIHKLRGFIPLCTMFFYYVLYLYKHSGMIGGKGIGIQGLSSGALHKLLVPLPPIAEQERIVKAIDRLWQVL